MEILQSPWMGDTITLLRLAVGFLACGDNRAAGREHATYPLPV